MSSNGDKAGRGLSFSWAFGLFTSALMVFSTCASASYTYSFTEPDANASVFYHDMALDGSGNPGIAYVDESGAEHVLRFAHYDGTGWDISTVVTGVGGIVSVAYDKDGNPTIAFASGGLKFAIYSSTTDTWTIEKADKKADGYCPSLAYDANGLPSISYNNGGLKFAQRSSAGVWTSVMIDKFAKAYWTSLAFDNSGKNPAIAYSDDTDRNLPLDTLKCARYDSVNKKWNTEVVDSGMETAFRPKIAYSGDGYPTILCHKIIDKKKYLGIVHWDSANDKWGAFESIILEQSGYGGFSLTYSGSTPYASYNYKSTTNEVRISCKTASGWESTVVDGSMVNDSYCTNLKVDSSGALKMTYADDWSLYYAVGTAD